MTTPPNLVLVTVDSLRADRCGILQPDADRSGLTPALDDLGREGLVFENAITPGPATPDAMPVIFTGEMTHARAVWDVPAREWIPHQMKSCDTIPERLSRLGYETSAFTANPWTSRHFGFDKGFDHFEDFLDVDQNKGRLEKALLGEGGRDGETTVRYAIQLLADWHRENNMFQSWQSFYEDIVAWTRQASEPYFLWVFLVDVHMPYLPAAQSAGSQVQNLVSNLWLYLAAPRFETLFRDSLVDAYDDTVRDFDATLNRFVDDLSPDDPVFVIHSDHGEEFGEHGVYGHGPNLYEEQIHTPLVVGNGPTGRVEEPFSLARLPELLTGLARGEDVTALTESVVTSRNWDPKFAARGRDWKYIRTAEDETVYELPAETEIDDASLLATGREAVDRMLDDSDECERLTAAGKAVARQHEL